MNLIALYHRGMDNSYYSKAFNTMGKRIEALLVSSEMSQKELTDAMRRHGASVTGSFVSQVIRGHKSMSVDNLVALVKALDTTLDYVVLGEGAPMPPATNGEIVYYSAEADRIAQQVDGMPPEARQFCLAFVEQFAAHEQRQRSAEYDSLLSMVERLVGREQRRLIETAVRGDLTGGASNGVAG